MDKEVTQPYMSLPTAETPLSPNIRSNPDWYPFFKNCVGAVDGSHIPVCVPVKEAKPWYDRRGNLSQNVFTACDFNLCFTYVLAGWEGSLSDVVLWDQARSGSFTIPQGKYVLGDAGFALNLSCLTPYKGVRYHLKEFAGDYTE